MASRLAEQLAIPVEWFEPEPGGQAQVYNRDYALVRSADRVEAFFDDDSMPGGTGHVVDAAISQNTPVYAWLVVERGGVHRIGEWEPDESEMYGF